MAIVSEIENWGGDNTSSQITSQYLYDNSLNPAGLQKNPKSFAASLMRYFPNGATTLFSLTGVAGRAEATNRVHGYFSKTWVIPTYTVSNDGEDVTSDATTITLESVAGLLENQLLYVPSTMEVMTISSISDTTITVQRATGRQAADAIADEATIIQFATAFPAGSSRPQARTISTVWRENYTQIFRDAWALTDTDRAIAMKLGFDNMAESKSDCALFHGQAIEAAMNFGQKATWQDSRSRNVSSMQGLWDSISEYAPDNVIAASQYTGMDDLEDWSDLCFDYTTATDNRTRIGFTGSAGMRVFQEIARAQNYDVNITRGETQFGMRYTSFKTLKGVFNLVEHPLYTKYGSEISSSIVFFDPTMIQLAYLGDRAQKTENFNVGGVSHGNDGTLESGIDAQGGSITTECTMEMLNPGGCVLVTGLESGEE